MYDVPTDASPDDLIVAFIQAATAGMTLENAVQRIWSGIEFLPVWRQRQASGVEISTRPWRPISTIKPDYIHVVRPHYDEFLKKPETASLARHLLAEGIIPPIKFTDGVVRPVVELPPEAIESHFMHLVSLLVRYVIEHYNTTQPDRGQIIESYRKFYQEATEEVGEKICTVPLLHFISDLQNVQLAGSPFRLSPFTPQEKTALWNLTSVELMSADVFGGTEYKLTATYPYNPQVAQTPSKPGIVEEAGQVITAMRLLKGGNVGMQALYETSERAVMGIGAGGIGALGTYTPAWLGQRYELTSADLPELLDTLAHLQTVEAKEESGGLRLALRRFNQSYSRSNEFAEDRLLDLTISLESCLLTATEDELRYRLSLRGAALLSQARMGKVKEVYELLGLMYDVRSFFVHEGKNFLNLHTNKKGRAKDLKNKIDKITSSEGDRKFLWMCEDVVRDILREYVTRLTSDSSLMHIGKINEQLDSAILDGLVPAQHRQGA